MANRIKMDKVHAIQRLRQQGWAERRISRELNIHRSTVRRYTDPSPHPDDNSKCTKAPTGSELADGSKCTTQAPPGKSRCEQYRKIIEDKISQGLSAQRIYQDLVADHGFTSKYHSVRRFVGKLRATTQLPVRRIEKGPGKEGQIDYGTGAGVISQKGSRRKTHVFRIVLGYSRKGYSESDYRQTADSFIQCLENSFWYFGGVPEVCVIDNLKAGVIEADWFDPLINPKLQAFADHYGTVIMPTKPYTPRHKGKIESGINYVQSNALKGKTFNSLAEQNTWLEHWERSVADKRIHGTTRKQVQKVFEEEERPALKPLPPCRFPFFNEAKRSVHRDGHIEVAKAYYSVPPEYTGRQVWARWDGKLVRVYDATKNFKQIATHAQLEPGRFSTDDKHIHARKFSKVELGAEALLKRVSWFGEHSQRWAKAMLEHRGIPGVRVLVGFESLAKSYDVDQIERACKTALGCGIFRLKPLRKLLKNGSSQPQESFEFMSEHEIIRDMASYGEVVRRAIGDGT